MEESSNRVGVQSLICQKLSLLVGSAVFGSYNYFVVAFPRLVDHIFFPMLLLLYFETLSTAQDIP